MRKIVYRTASCHPAVNLLIDIRHPDHVHTKFAEISFARLLKHSHEITAMESGGVKPFAAVIHFSAIVDIIGRVSIAESVCYNEINCCLSPVESRFLYICQNAQTCQEKCQH